MHAACIGSAEEENRKQGVDQQDIFSRVVLLLAALTRGLFRRVLGADDTPCRAVPSGAQGGTPALGLALRPGASPRARSAASSMGKRPCIH